MATTVDMIDNLQRIGFEAIVSKIFALNAQHITTLLQGQMYAGKTGKGEKMRYSYQNPNYAAMKSKKNPLPGPGNPDLYLTGAFYKGMKTTVKGQLIETDSTDSKAGELLDKYGEDIFLAGDETRTNFNESVFMPDFAVEIEKQTGLKLTI